MKKLIKKLTRSKAFSYLVYLVARIYLLFVAGTVKNDGKWLELMGQKKPVLICMFHQQFFAIVRFFRPYLCFHPRILISQSRDGDLASDVVIYSGGSVARGSSSRGGREAMAEMVDHMASGAGFGLNLVDGPQGPRGVVKAGSIRMAQRAGAVIVPCFVKYKDAWLLGSWDRYMIPKPFTRMTMTFGDPIPVDPDAAGDDFEQLRRELEDHMAPHLVERS
ncbi:MAG: lysophospholipid acyltransferase family protein [Desulfobacterales bacterium]|nr:lysophospholipid acyltransferase family protein [Desulfobacterales bacterium]